MFEMISYSLALCVILAFAPVPGRAAAEAEQLCDPEVCTNATYAAEVNKSEALDSYNACLARSRNVTAFMCRCTPRVFECMVNSSLGACSKQRARTHCWRYVVEQGLGCSQKLCKASATASSVAVA
eukprot:CAMPEP_0174861394 /NCGR_PEP_ID=MMETSP1114-20130205/51509_1 /TAXON_ID=312471 /ORGANISM="Neobodo designis, Strain CCAP 1951/1" /LENGTH=125 /DNA_ID=CAMNT_0016096405 /DNA_START=27 /DNA_END=401 /DNA_ORIENTATION=+